MVSRQVAAIFASSTHPTFAAHAATKTIPVVFISAEDPVRLGLVASLARPSGNLTGINYFDAELTAKRLELRRELALLWQISRAWDSQITFSVTHGWSAFWCKNF
jgi:ABC-type uncharacterized transport system substrate-binding protein